jgi:hypothetical protein
MRAPAGGAHDPSVHRSVLALAAALAAGSVLATAGPAAADGPLAPGETRTIQLAVPEKWSAALQVDVTVGSVSESENGCLDPEREAGDDCRSAAGELAGQLTSIVTLGLPDGEDCTPGQRAELDLSGGRTARLTAASPGVRCLFVELTFRDDASNNRAQSDSVTLGLDLVARDHVVGGDARAGGQVVPNADSEALSVENGATTTRPGADEVDPGDAEAAAQGPGEPPSTVVDQTAEGPVLDRLEAQISVGDDDGAGLETQAADASVQGQVLTWGSLLLGSVAVGWSTSVMVRRRRGIA